MKLYNTLTKKIEEFIPNEEGKVKMYTCGPTVYHYAHIGNLRTYIFEDILEKGLEFVGYDVTRVMNITDVGHLTSDGDTGEDKMAKGAAREGKTVYEIAEFYTNAFFNDMSDLNIRKPSIIEKASDNIDKYIEMIEKMLNDGYAYISNGNVYFDTSMGFECFPSEQFLRIVKNHGADKILFGSDSPWSNASKELEILNSLPLTDEEKQLITSENAKRLLKI